MVFSFLCITGFGALLSAASTETATSVEISTATGDSIIYNDQTGVAVIEGKAEVVTSTAILKADKITVDSKEKHGHLEGNVSVEQTSGTIMGSEVFYDWALSTGVIFNAEGVSPPWHFTAQNMVQEGPGLFRLYNGYLTSCDLNPPHYQMRSRQAKVIVGKKATSKNTRFIIDETPVFWTPYYSRSLIPKKICSAD